jgi:hypothetical protein
MQPEKITGIGGKVKTTVFYSSHNSSPHWFLCRATITHLLHPWFSPNPNGKYEFSNAPFHEIDH